ncbi:embigin isoform X2 [Siniperca chuatsi]|uniref:embigin isoform X2 n=1 Tax=Siniperca chuatsi TaxID=119488 RepID=UPI001CE1152D|nr:embigin isoform X2 [Siniperca chuatsi]
MQQAETGKERVRNLPAERTERIIIMSATWKQLFFQILLLLVSCRHINTKTPGPTPPPLDPISPLPNDVRSFVLKGESHTEKVELSKAVNLVLECIWTGNQNKLPNITGFWRKDGDEIENSRLTVQLENDQYNLKREFSIVSEENLGNYSCVFGSEAKIDFVVGAPQIGEMRDKPIVSYVGDSVVITCKMEETKPKPNTWNWYKANGTEKIFADAEPHRYEIKNEERKTTLVVHNLTETDSGLFYCGAVYTIGTTVGHMELRVITIYEPLKPFIAIVVEVIVLVAAILLYERSQSKKNYTTENGPNDQTNTLTQGENNGSEGSSSMRQRKV